MKTKKSTRFLAKLNPHATLRTVARSVCMSCSGAAALWGLAIVFHFNPNFQPSWSSFVLWMICAGLVGAIYEWQVPKEKSKWIE